LTAVAAAEQRMKRYRRAWIQTAFAVAAGLIVSPAQAQPRAAAGGADVVVEALSLLGTPYRYGGSSPQTGFDCSGLVRHVFGTVLNRDLPRRTEDLGTVGQPVARADLQPGDLVFFNTLRRAFSHVAIYVGDGRFVHAPAGRGQVRVEALGDRYWSTRFDGARRLVGPAQAPTTFAASPAAPIPAGDRRVVPFFDPDRPPEP
jgi:cell wall-associated NlpC family hydrolase